MTAIDVVLLVILGVIVINAGRRGFLREGALMLGLGVGLYVAGRYATRAATMFWQDSPQPGVVVLASYLGLLLAVLVAVALATTVVQPVLQTPGLRLFDHVAGLGVGLCEGMLLASLVALTAARVGLVSPEHAWSGSRLAPFLVDWLSAVVRGLPPEVTSFERLL